MPDSPDRLGLWAQELHNIEEGCPYVGPRPQQAEDEGMLIGRTDDLEMLARKVVEHRLVVVDGESGSGKTSLLQNGLIDMLDGKRWKVLVVRDWLQLPAREEFIKDDAVESYIVGCIDETHREAGSPQKRGEVLKELALVEPGRTQSLSEAVYRNRKFRSATVLVLDQFEELLRRPERKCVERVARWVRDITGNDAFHVVVSLRSDSYHRLAPLLRGVRPFSSTRYTVPEITDGEFIGEIVMKWRNRKDSDSESGVEDLAVQALLKKWGDYRPSLLNLQATLYALYFRAKAEQLGNGAGIRIREKDVTVLGDEAQSIEGSDADPFSYGLREAIRLKIEHADDACKRVPLDDYLRLGTCEMVRRAAPMLSSGTFKVPIPGKQLAARVLEREFAILKADVGDELGLPRGDKRVRDLVAALFVALGEGGVLTAGLSDPQIAELLDAPAETDGDMPSAQRHVDVTAGPMMGLSARATLLEEIRRAAFAVEWLVQTGILSRRKDTEGTLLLVHDGSGGALVSWAEKNEPGHEMALHQVTGARGEHFYWLPDDPEAVARGEAYGDWICPKTTSDQPNQYRTFANVNWRDCRISAWFRDVVFVNCDFSGSRFEECRFQGVTFVNCLLDDANFESCKLVGSTTLAEVKRDRERVEEDLRGYLAPSFTVEADPQVVIAFHSYRDELPGDWCEWPPSRLYSDTSGLPARSLEWKDDPARVHLAHITMEDVEGRSEKAPARIRPVRGGVAMIGGRLSFLTIHSCESLDEGSFVFHHVSGDGLYIVEQCGGAISLFDAAVRGISITRDDALASGKKTSRPHSVALRVDDCKVHNVYVAGRVHGNAELSGSRVFMLTNVSENSKHGFQIQLKDCRYQVLANVSEPPDSTEDSSQAPPEKRYFARAVGCSDGPRSSSGCDSRFDLPGRDELAVILESMDYRSRPEVWEQRQRRLLNDAGGAADAS